jgi:hypothetical protein
VCRAGAAADSNCPAAAVRRGSIDCLSTAEHDHACRTSGRHTKRLVFASAGWLNDTNPSICCSWLQCFNCSRKRCSQRSCCPVRVLGKPAPCFQTLPQHTCPSQQWARAKKVVLHSCCPRGSQGELVRQKRHRRACRKGCGQRKDQGETPRSFVWSGRHQGSTTPQSTAETINRPHLFTMDFLEV